MTTFFLTAVIAAIVQAAITQTLVYLLLMPINRVRLRQLHRTLVPFMILPLLLTLTTGVLFQFAAISDRASDFIWLIDLHKGKFGSVNLEMLYPFLNALGLLTFIITGSMMWYQSRGRKTRA